MIMTMTISLSGSSIDHVYILGRPGVLVSFLSVPFLCGGGVDLRYARSRLKDPGQECMREQKDDAGGWFHSYAVLAI